MAIVSFALNKCYHGLSLRDTATKCVFLNFFCCDDFESVMHHALSLSQHHDLVDDLRVRSPFFWQVELLPLEVVKLSLLSQVSKLVSQSAQ